MIALLCCAYILGLLCSALPWGTLGLVGVGLMAAVMRLIALFACAKRATNTLFWAFVKDFAARAALGSFTT